MPISDKYKTIFIHIPKAAGTSIEYVLEMHEVDDVGVNRYLKPISICKNKLFGGPYQHMPFTSLSKHISPDKIDNYFKFAIVRNPWDRMVSHVAWLDGKWYNKRELTQEEFNTYIANLFKRFKENGERVTFDKFTQHEIPQYKFIYDTSDNDKLLVDYVGKFENLDEDWKIIRERLGVQLELPTRMKSHHRKYTSFYNQQTKEVVDKIYKDDIEKFNYKF